MTDLNDPDVIFSDLPVNYNEYIKFMKISEWPGKLTSENILSLREELIDFQDVETIENELTTDISISFEQFDKFEQELSEHDDFLMRYASAILDVPKLLSKIATPNEKVVNEMFEKLGNKVRESLRLVADQNLTTNSTELTNSIVALNMKSVDFYPYTGFTEDKVTDLPGTIDLLDLMRFVVRRVKIGKHFRPIWWRIFSLEPSVKIIHDLFWWIFLDYFKDEDEIHSLDTDKINFFSRISLNFGMLLMSTEEELANRYLLLYPDVLAMTIYTLFYHSFPSSRLLFGPDFKQRLINICHIWITGVQPLPNSFTSWPIEQLHTATNVTLPVDKHNQSEKEAAKSTLPKLKNSSNNVSFTYSKILFDPNACSPLIHKFLQLHNIEPSGSARSRMINRLELNPITDPNMISMTHDEQMKELLKNKLDRQAKYQDILNENERQIKLFAKEREILEKRFENMQKEIDECTNVLDMRKALQDFVNSN